MKTTSTVNGIASISVGTIDTRATNQVCRMNSRHANGGLNIATKVSSDIAKNPPTERTGFAKESAVTTTAPCRRAQALRRCARRPARRSAGPLPEASSAVSLHHLTCYPSYNCDS